MNDLSADPQRLYTVCRVIALGGDRDNLQQENSEEDARQHLLQLVRFDPTHAIWTQRTHYMSMDPRDWPYLRLTDEDLDDEAKLAEINERMKVGLAILDEFFASFNQVGFSVDLRPGFVLTKSNFDSLPLAVPFLPGSAFDASFRALVEYSVLRPQTWRTWSLVSDQLITRGTLLPLHHIPPSLHKTPSPCRPWRLGLPFPHKRIRRRSHLANLVIQKFILK